MDQRAYDTFEFGEGLDDSASLFSAGGPFEGFPGALVLAGHNGIVLSANAQAESICALLRSDSHPELREGIRSALAGATAQIHPLLVPEPETGREVTRAYDLVILPWVEGTAVLLLARDITLERTLRATLVEAHDRFKALVDLAADFAWECGSDGRFTYLSKERVLGYSAIDLLGAAAHDTLLADLPGGPNPFTAKAPSGPIRCQLRRQGGTLVTAEVLAEPFFDREGTHLGVRGLCRCQTIANDG
ncbi:MAG TPA: PAS domain-containing protein [Kiloniellaceae bacterium]|nr:PAS domain-containing protein [Kiloniellaceae bacterium]